MPNESFDRDCGRLRGELAAYLYGELARDARDAIERHLEACTPCADELAGLRETRALLARWETPPAAEDPAELARSIAAAAAGAPAPRSWRPRIVRWGALVSGAAAALLFTLSLLDADVRVGAGRFELSFGGAPATREALDPAVRRELEAIAAREVALRTADLELDQEALVSRILQMTREEQLRLSQAVDIALAQTQRAWDTRLTTFEREAARADLETRRALTEVAAYLPVVDPTHR